MKRLSEEVRQRIISLYNGGKLQREIVEETGVSKVSVYRILKDAGLDKFHVGGKTAKSVHIAPSELPKAQEKPEDPVAITGRTMNLHGHVSGCDFVAGTHMQTVDITLGDWAMSIDRAKISGFIAELAYIKKMIGA